MHHLIAIFLLLLPRAVGWRKTGLYVSVALLAFYPCVIMAGSEGQDPITDNRKSPFIGVQTTDTTPIAIQIGDSEYSIPANYFDFQPDPRCNARAALFRVLFPAIEPRSKDNGQLFNVVGQRRTAGNILLNYHQHTNPEFPFDGSLSRALHALLKVYGLSESAGEEHGLTRIIAQENPRNNTKHEAFTDNTQNPSRFIVCSTPGSVPSPGCDLYFYNMTIQVKAHFSRGFLSDWRLIESNIKQRLNGFYSGQVSNQKVPCKN